MIKNAIILLSFLSIVTKGISQNQTTNWYFGDGAGISFNNGSMMVLNNGAMLAPAGCSSISDNDGNLLFYTNGATVWNSNHQIMENGSGLSGLTDQTQTSIIIPNPENEALYYLFSIRKDSGNTFEKGVYYSTIEFSTTHPLGHITEKNIHLVNESSERITAIYIPELNYYKVITFSREPYIFVFGVPLPEDEPIDTFSFFNVTQNGVTISSTVTTNIPAISMAGAMKVSPNGEHLAIADNEKNRIYLYDIDAQSESIQYSTHIFTGLFGAPEIFSYGLEFSPDSQILYYSSFKDNSSAIFKYIINSQEVINDKIFVGSSLQHMVGSLQLAIDGKIYISNYSTNDTNIDKISVINKPNEPSAECGFESLNIDVSPKFSKKGLPNFVQTFFENRIIAEEQCVSEIFSFDLNAYGPIESVVWEFGDGNVSNDINPSHQYLNDGIYTVKATIIVYGKTIELYKQLEVYPLPIVTDGLTITQCDTDSDGISYFNLYDFANQIENNNEQDFELSFYHSYDDALNESSPIENPEIYQNLSNPEQIFTKIISPRGCVTIGNFFIESSYAYLGDIDAIYACEGSDGIFENSIGKFVLSNKIEEIRALFSIPESSIITFYQSLQDAQTMTNSLRNNIDTASTSIWVTISNVDGTCGGIGSFNLIVTSNIYIDIEDQYVLCHESMQPPLVLDGGISNHNWEWRDNNDTILSNQRLFTVHEPGNYSLTAYKTEYGIECSRVKTFNVAQSGIPTFNEVIARDYQIEIDINGNSSYEYSLDGSNYFGQGTKHTFTNVNAGIYTVYVRDQENCEPPINKTISLIGIPKFFTPNGDGKNDSWKIEGVSNALYQSLEVWIFDRYGKSLVFMDLNTNNQGWDGTFNGQTLTTTDYWFKAILTDQQLNKLVFAGHFSLIN